jgi:hypothetical protein
VMCVNHSAKFAIIVRTTGFEPAIFFQRYLLCASLFLGPKCRCRPATPVPKTGVFLLHYILDIQDR